MATQIQLRRDTAANWAATNPILAEGEQGFETDGLGTDTVKYKIGNGVDDWSTLPYQTTGGSGDVEEAPINGKKYNRKDAGWEVDQPEEIPSFNSDIVFNKEKYIEHNQTGAIIYTLNATQPTDGEHVRKDVINGNGDPITLPASVKAYGDVIDSTKRMFIDFQYLAYADTIFANIRSTALVPTDAPLILSSSMESDNSGILVTFDKGVYGDGSVPVSINDVSIAYTANGDSVSGVTKTTITKSNGDALTGGETIVKVQFNQTGAPSTGLGALDVTFTNIEDISGNVAASLSTGDVLLANLSTLILNELEEITNIGNTYNRTNNIKQSFGVLSTHKLIADGGMRFVLVEGDVYIGLDTDDVLENRTDWTNFVRMTPTNNLNKYDGTTTTTVDTGVSYVSGVSELEIMRDGSDDIHLNYYEDGTNLTTTSLIKNQTGDLWAKITFGAVADPNYEIRNLVMTNFTAI